MRTTLVVARLTLDTPGGFTAPERSVVDRRRNLLPLRRDPNGHLHVPGTSLAGALKRHCRRRPELVDAFGSDPGAEPRIPSAVQVLGCVLTSAPTVQVRARTAISRYRGAAGARTLHAVEQLPAGTAFDLVLRWNDPEPGRIEALSAALREWVPTLGRGTSTGAGRCTVTHLGHKSYDLSTADGLWAWLALADGQPRAYPAPVEISAIASPVAHRRVRVAVVDALHVGTGDPGRVGDHDVNPVVRRKGRVILPATSVKGVLRSRAEYIAARCGVLACPGSQPPTCPAAAPCPTCRIFGRATAKGETTGGRRAAIVFHDAQIADAVVEHRTHVALDRFTGGSRPQLLYTDEVVTAGTFTITVDELDRALTPAEAALLDAALADLGDGLVGLGARTTAGYGTVAIDDATWRPPDLPALAGLLRSDAA